LAVLSISKEIKLFYTGVSQMEEDGEEFFIDN